MKEIPEHSRILINLNEFDMLFWDLTDIKLTMVIPIVSLQLGWV